jgi:hypothetical protein
VDDHNTLVGELDQILAPGGRITFSLYDTVFQPDNAWRWPLDWPAVGPRQDPLMDDLVAALRRKGHDVAARTEDRRILAEDALHALFAAHGLVVRCTGMLRLVRGTAERVSFFRIPAVAAENFPTVPFDVVQEALDNLDPPSGLPPTHRTVYAFTAVRTGP